MKELQNIALFDLDGTLADFDFAMHRDMNELYSPDEPRYDPWNRSIPHIVKRKKLIMKQPGWWRNLPVYKPGKMVLDLALHLEFDVHILTKGPSSSSRAWGEKRDWCYDNLNVEQNDIKITMTEDKGLVYGKVLVDDWPEYIESWLAYRPRGLVIMPNHAHNQGFKHPNVIRYTNNWDEVREAMIIVKDREPGEELCIS